MGNTQISPVIRSPIFRKPDLDILQQKASDSLVKTFEGSQKTFSLQPSSLNSRRE